MYSEPGYKGAISAKSENGIIGVVIYYSLLILQIRQFSRFILPFSNWALRIGEKYNRSCDPLFTSNSTVNYFNSQVSFYYSLIHQYLRFLSHPRANLTKCNTSSEKKWSTVSPSWQKKLTRSYSLSCSAQKEVWQRIDKQRTWFHQNLPHLQKRK